MSDQPSGGAATGRERSPLRRARWMLGIVAAGLFVSGVTIWPAIGELNLAVDLFWGEGPAQGPLHAFVLELIGTLEHMDAEHPILWYGYDWLAFAHIMLAILFLGAIRDPVKNIWVVRFGLIACVLVPVLAGIFIPIRGLPPFWFWIDFAFAPGAALPLIIAYRDLRRAGG